MELTLDQKTSVGLGYSTHTDAFQRGREAAQSAKSQLGDGPVDLVLIFGPGTVHFKDFIEGVRLVLGENTLVALPSERVFSSETNLTDSCFLAAFRSDAMKITLAADDNENASALQCTTSLLTQFRQSRGNLTRNYKNRGGLIFSHQVDDSVQDLPFSLTADMNLESWLVGCSTITKSGVPFYFTNRTISRGLLAIEFLSIKPFGIGSVAMRAFLTQSDVYREALKAALRDATGQMASNPPCFGLVFFDLTNESATQIPEDILISASSQLPQVPLLGISTNGHFCRRINRSVPAAGDSILVMLVPR